jgi:uncharacterized protein GlcG (DUF336 family)
MTQLEECTLISNLANTVITRHGNPLTVIRSLGNLMCTIGSKLDDQDKARCVNVLRDVSDILEADVMKRCKQVVRHLQCNREGAFPSCS